jgi:hypothetical protein
MEALNDKLKSFVCKRERSGVKRLEYPYGDKLLVWLPIDNAPDKIQF